MTAPAHSAGGPADPRALAGTSVLVAGAGVAGSSAARALLDLGASVTMVDDGRDGDGAIGTTEAAEGIAGHSLVVMSPGWRPANALAQAAARAGVPVWGDVELAWRCDRAGVYGSPRRWLAVTGTNGKTTTTSMLHSILQAAGRSSSACGNIGLPVLDALAAERRPDVLAVELSSFQLHWAPSVVPEAATVLNVAEDHLDWHGGMDAYTRAKAQVLRGRVGVLGLDDPGAAGLAGLSAADRTVGFRLGDPAPGELGVHAGMLTDRAFADGQGAALIAADRIVPGGAAGMLDALAASALARAAGVTPEAIAAGLGAHTVGPHRASTVATVGGVVYVDDSKATNPHAALASIAGRDRVVWIAGGLLKGASVDDLVAAVAPRLGAAVLIGRDRGVLAEALARHAPEVPVTEVVTREDGSVMCSSRPVPTGAEEADPRAATADEAAGVNASDVMDTVVGAAARYARPGDTVLLAPAAASMDMFRDYAQRGDRFAAAVTRLREGR